MRERDIRNPVTGWAPTFGWRLLFAYRLAAAAARKNAFTSNLIHSARLWTGGDA